jgi:hypothetical protein
MVRILLEVTSAAVLQDNNDSLAYTMDYSDAANPFKAPVSYLQHSQAVGINSAYRAAQLLLESTAPASQKHFIYTGNMLHRSPHPAMLGLGMEKAGAVHFIAVGAKAYGAQGGPLYVYKIISYVLVRLLTSI